MKKIYDLESTTPTAKSIVTLPYPGRYTAMICNVETRMIEPLVENEELCLVVTYMLINSETKELFDLVETYGLYHANPRSIDFKAFLDQHGFDLLSDDDIIGITADVEIVNEYIGGFMHPVISYRRWGIDKALQSYGDEKRSIY